MQAMGSRQEGTGPSVPRPHTGSPRGGVQIGGRQDVEMGGRQPHSRGQGGHAIHPNAPWNTCCLLGTVPDPGMLFLLIFKHFAQVIRAQC